LKPPRFEYHAPTTVDEALKILEAHSNARILAGGQSLMPMLNMRIAFPDHLVDINRIAGLAGIREEGSYVTIGSMTRQREIEYSAIVRARLPLLAEAITWVGHRQTRNRGTFGGSLCHLDPSAEQPTVAMAMDGVMEIAGPQGKRDMSMQEFAVDVMTSALAPTEMLTAVKLSAWSSRHGWAFLEFARRHGDFAIVSVAVLVELDGQQRIGRVSLTLGGVCRTPMRLRASERALVGMRGDGVDLTAARRECDGLDAMSDPHVPAWYRRRVAFTLLTRAIPVAIERARQGKDPR
jgi:aerobic carbon-monoxide dehydrogenase medium subunit